MRRPNIIQKILRKKTLAFFLYAVYNLAVCAFLRIYKKEKEENEEI